jgi:uncharacterized LabA/DUF88 family protein
MKPRHSSRGYGHEREPEQARARRELVDHASDLISEHYSGWSRSVGRMLDFSELRTMVFVDGENFTIRGQEFAKQASIDLIRGPYWERDTFLWLPGDRGDVPVFTGGAVVARHEGRDVRAERAHYYTAVTGDDEALETARLAVRELGFDPHVFKKVKGTRSKGVDVSLTTDVIAHAYRGAYEVAYLIAGDGDYAPMVEETGRMQSHCRLLREARLEPRASDCGRRICRRYRALLRRLAWRDRRRASRKKGR